jgi:uncharacterized RDD family membrane protein YckC
MNKDFWRGRSIAKRLVGLQLIDVATGHSPSSVKCFVRNITLMLWPVEVLLLLIQPARRIGDYIVGTACADFAAPTSPADGVGAAKSIEVSSS